MIDQPNHLFFPAEDVDPSTFICTTADPQAATGEAKAERKCVEQTLHQTAVQHDPIGSWIGVFF